MIYIIIYIVIYNDDFYLIIYMDYLISYNRHKPKREFPIQT